jgi:tRNA pseudouridine38-40 synthase
LPGPEGIPPAPAEPLVLDAVDYPGLSFDRDAGAAESARSAFDERAIDGRVRARVAGHVRDGVRAADGETPDAGQSTTE